VLRTGQAHARACAICGATNTLKHPLYYPSIRLSCLSTADRKVPVLLRSSACSYARRPRRDGPLHLFSTEGCDDGPCPRAPPQLPISALLSTGRTIYLTRRAYTRNTCMSAHALSWSTALAHTAEQRASGQDTGVGRENDECVQEKQNRGAVLRSIIPTYVHHLGPLHTPGQLLPPAEQRTEAVPPPRTTPQ